MAKGEVVPGEMTRGDRQELRRVVKGRYALLHDELDGRIESVKSIIRTRLREERKRDIKKANDDGQKLAEEIRAAVEKAMEFRGKHKAKGLKPKGSQEDLRYYSNSVIDTITGWTPDNLEDRVREEFAKFQQEAGSARLSLRGEELRLLERLSVDALQSQAAQDFLNKIPDIDDILPLPDGKAAVLEPTTER